ncbi:MAG: GMP/IMP nucleotidase [Chromatiales bacterium]|nr:MAG: GMP/IMP nucleotidase [Chromatiales bacterium]
MNLDPQSALRDSTTLMLDMDGTLLDLAFDNYVWKELVPRRYAVENNMPFEEARELLMAKYAAVQGGLEWYCLDHWSDRLDMDVVQLHYDVSHRIGYLPGALEFLRRVHEQDVRVLLVTNAHRDTLALKDAMTGLGDYFDGLYSSHDYGYAKESQNFWCALQEDVGFDLDTTLFVDDSLPVLRSAQEYGIERLVTVTQPDTTEAIRPTTEFRCVQRVAELLD